MVQGFSVQSGGTVRIRSKPGVGTTVELWLPQADEPASGKAGDRSLLEIGRGTTCALLCDDDDDVRPFLSEFLRSIGYTVHEASGAEAAIHILESRAEVDLLIVDYAMPGMNGIETIRQARLRRPDLRSLLITGHAGVPSNAGVPLLRKPFAPDGGYASLGGEIHACVTRKPSRAAKSHSRGLGDARGQCGCDRRHPRDATPCADSHGTEPHYSELDPAVAGWRSWAMRGLRTGSRRPRRWSSAFGWRWGKRWFHRRRLDHRDRTRPEPIPGHQATGLICRRDEG